MGRPPDYEWSVLGEGQDPIPGDPHEIRDQATRLGKMGQTIQDQVRLLKKIATDDNLSVGKYADKIRGAARDLESGLGTLAKRYDSVSGYLGQWATDLEHCQSESLKALAKAQEAAPTANAPHKPPAPGEQQHLTPQQEQQQAAAKKKQEAAQGDLDAAKRQLESAKQYRDERGRYWKQKIEDAEHDDLKDHGLLEWASNEIHAHAELIKLLSDVCTWIVTVLVIAALLIPGFDVAALLLFAIASAALVGHTALALNGDGSWTDVAMDIVAVATIGVGGVAASGLKASSKVAEGLLESSEGSEEAGESAAAAVAEETDQAGATASRSAIGKTYAKVADYGKYLGRAVKAGGDSKAAEHLEKIQEAIKLNPNSRWAIKAGARASQHLSSLRISGSIGNAFDQYGHWTGNSDLVNFAGNGIETGHWTDGSILHGTGLLHPDLTDGTAPHWEPMDNLKKLTTFGFA